MFGRKGVLSATSLIFGLLLILASFGLALSSPTLTLAQIAPTPTALSGSAATQQAQIQATAAAQISPVVKPSDGNPSIDGVRAIPVTGSGGTQLWVAYTYGLKAYVPDEQHHFVAIYQPNGSGWKQLAKLELQNADYVDQTGVTQLQITPSLLTLGVESGVGAHSGCYDLLTFDGTSLKDAVSGCSSSAGAGEAKDVNGDGVQDIVLNASDYYVFCYACGVVTRDYTVYYWDGANFTQAKLQHVSNTDADKAVTLAEAGLYKEATTLADQAAQANPNDQTIKWNAALIKYTAAARADQVSNGPYPILDNVFYGDYNAAVDSMRKYSVAQIFSQQTPLIVGSDAESEPDEVTKPLIDSSSAALGVEPNLAPAYFLRAWAEYQANPQDASAIADLQQAVNNAPSDTLYTASLQYLQSGKGVPGMPVTGAGNSLQTAWLLFGAGLALVLVSLLIRFRLGRV